jgi:protection of telomeres protein 1
MPGGDHITYPFMNIAFRSQVRVVDFYPPKLEDFSHSLDDPGYNDDPDPEDSSYMDIDMDPIPRWEWGFWLLLEDLKKNSRQEHEQMKVLVSGSDAEYLLKLTACK